MASVFVAAASAVVVGFAFAAPVAAAKLTPAVINAEASLSGPSVRGLGISPDGSLVTLLKGRADDANRLDLWAVDAATGAERMLVSSTELAPDRPLSEEEKNRRERQRVYETGIVDYDWDASGRRLLVPLGGDVFVYDLAAKSAVRVTETAAYETDARFSPGGRYVSFVRNDEVVVVDLARRRERQVTKGANGVVRNGVAEFAAQEELDRDTGYWWSPDERRIAFTQIDESPVPVAERVDFNSDGVVTVRQRYPFAGGANVRIKLGVTTPEGRKPVWVDLGADPNIYVARVYWRRDGARLYVVRLSRDQKTLDFLEADPSTGRTRTLFTERSPTWINTHKAFRALKDGGFLWASEDQGFLQLYRYDRDGRRLNAVTTGPGVVESLDCVDETAGAVYYAGWRASPIDRHLFRAPLAGGAPTQLTTKPGQHVAAYSDNCRTAIRRWSDDENPPQLGVYGAADGAFRFWLNENRVGPGHPYAPYKAAHIPWVYGQILAADGTTRLDYKYLKPAGLKAGERAPAIIHVYGGPGVQYVANAWNERWDLIAQMFAQNGYVVFRLDNRGAANRGTAFESALYRSLGRAEVADQAEGAKFLKSLPFVDGARIGVYGWSYGGYMTLRMLTATPSLYAAGVAGAPVTDWARYDSTYTERYLGLPDGKGGVYEKSSVFSDLGALKAPLLLVHGMADDNVFFAHSARLMGALQQRGLPFEAMPYPGEKHGFRSTANKIHRDQIILDFFDRTLKAK